MHHPKEMEKPKLENAQLKAQLVIHQQQMTNHGQIDPSTQQDNQKMINVGDIRLSVNSSDDTKNDSFGSGQVLSPGFDG